MADLKISELSAATDLAAAEFEIIQGGTNKRASSTLIYSPPSLELGHASDTTITRGAAGFIAVEGNRVPSPASQAAGDILYRGTVEWERLAKGTAGQVLAMNSGATAPEWATARVVLTANRTYYVRTDGSDSNDGLANTSGGAFLTIQKAISTIIGSLDLSGYTVTVQVGDGTYSGNASFSAPWTGGGAVVIRGNSTTPSNVLISVTGNAIINSGVLPGTLTVRDMKLTSSGGGLIVNTGVGLINFTNIDFGSAAAGHVLASGPAARITGTGNYAITGGATTHNEAIYGGLVLVNSRTVTITGTPAFSSAFAYAWRTGTVDVFNNTYSGSATGVRYTANMNGVIIVGGAGATYLPGDASGSTATGGQYA